MVRAVFYRKQERICRFAVSGHADDERSEGASVVCAGVSALVIGTVNSVEALTDATFIVEDADAQKGSLVFSFREPPKEDASLLMDSLLLGLKGIQARYGKQYLRVTVKEV